MSDPLHLTLLLLAAFGAGTLNAVAGGGSFLTLPALVFAGLPPVVANATGTVALLPGYVSGAWGFREELQAPPGLTLPRLALLSLMGGAAGAALLLVTDDRIFRILIPWLLLAATALFAIGPALVRNTRTQAGSVPSTWRATIGVVLVSVYGGYFNGGLGILLLALFGMLGQSNLHAANASKNIVSALLTAIAVLVYAAGGLVSWPHALVMMLAATAGGYAGARLARRLPPAVLRAAIVCIGLAMAAVFFMRG
ncbi:MAG: sulfite exporter TauE/SafE family protein [Burkholderiaceae bacterium]